MFKKIKNQLDRLESLIARGDEKNELVSNWSIYQQVEHILIATNNVAKMILAGEEPKEVKKRTLLGYIVLTFGVIPRGKAQAPKMSIPKGVLQSELLDLFKESKKGIEEVEKLGKKIDSCLVVGNHPYFGGLNTKEWLRFIEVHTNHHLKIIDDI